MEKNIRADVLRVALKELKSRGPDFHMDDLARTLHISKRTLYEHFSSKQEIVKAAIFSVMDDLYEQHEALIADKNLSVEEKLLAYFRVRSEALAILTLRRYESILHKMPEIGSELEARSKRDWDLLLRFLQDVKKSQGYKDFFERALLHMLMGAGESLLKHLNEVGEEYDVAYPEYMEECMRIILYGIKKT